MAHSIKYFTYKNVLLLEKEKKQEEKRSMLVLFVCVMMNGMLLYMRKMENKAVNLGESFAYITKCMYKHQRRIQFENQKKKHEREIFFSF